MVEVGAEVAEVGAEVAEVGAEVAEVAEVGAEVAEVAIGTTLGRAGDTVAGVASEATRTNELISRFTFSFSRVHVVHLHVSHWTVEDISLVGGLTFSSNCKNKFHFSKEKHLLGKRDAFSIKYS
jgi:hypothetical protein